MVIDILSQHKLCEADGESFDSFQNIEQLNKCLITLKEDYKDLQKQGILCENESEFQGYYIINHIDGDIYDYISNISTPSVRYSPQVKLALQVI